MDIVFQLAVNGILIGGVYGLVSVGLTLIFGVMRIVNFAHGEFLMLGMFAGYWAFSLLGLDPNLTALLLLPVFFALGLLTHFLVIKPVLAAPALTQFFATIGLSVLLQNAALLVWGADLRSVRTGYAQKFLEFGEVTVSVARLVTFGASLAISVALIAFLHLTFVGKAMRAIVQNRETALLIGIPIGRIYALAFAIGVRARRARGRNHHAHFSNVSKRGPQLRAHGIRSRGARRDGQHRGCDRGRHIDRPRRSLQRLLHRSDNEGGRLLRNLLGDTASATLGAIRGFGI